MRRRSGQPAGDRRAIRPRVQALEDRQLLAADFQIASVAASYSESAAALVFTVSQVGSITESTTIDYRTIDGAALAGQDYTATAGRLTFAPGGAQQTISVTIIGDNKLEGLESFSLQLHNPQAGVISVADGQRDD